MELEELQKHVELALKTCQDIITTNKNVVLSEGDLERLVCKCISEEIKENICNPEGFSVHSQISHYYEKDGKPSIDARVDILLLYESGLHGKINHKEFKYEGDSMAIELKYLHRNDSLSKVKCDFCKWGSLKEDSWMYVVVLIDGANKQDIDEKEKEIASMWKETSEKNGDEKNQLFYFVLRKII